MQQISEKNLSKDGIFGKKETSKYLTKMCFYKKIFLYKNCDKKYVDFYSKFE